MKIIRNNVWHHSDKMVSEHIKWSFWNDKIPFGDKYICFNTYTGAIVVFNKEEYSECANNHLSPHSSSILAKLGIIVPEQIDEKHEWYEKYRHGKKNTSILDLTIILTLKCQFNCVYCFEGEKSNMVLKDKTCEDIKEFIKSRAGHFHTLHITWFGGEPLLEINRLKELSIFFLDFCRRHGVKYYADITTNGYALTPSKCNLLINECSVKRYIITIDGTTTIHDKRRPLKNGKGTFDVIWGNIATLIKTGADVTIRATIDKSNSDHIKDLIDLIANCEWSKRVNLAFVRTIDYLFTPKNIYNTIYTYDEFAKIEMKFIKYAHLRGILPYKTPRPCPLGGCLRKGDIVIGTEGEIYKCLDTIGEKEWIVGHITDESDLPEVNWYQDWLSWEPSKSSDCKECKLIPLCNGGCPHNALFLSKKHGADNQCPDWKLNYRNQIQLYVEEKLLSNEYQEI